MGEVFSVMGMVADALSAPAEPGPRMDVAGSVDMLAFGFDSQGSLPPELAQHLDGLRGRGILRILDVLFVSKDSHGTFRAHRGDSDLDASRRSRRVDALAAARRRQPRVGHRHGRAARATHIVGGRPRSRLDRASRAAHRAGHIRVAHVGTSEVGDRPPRRRAPVRRVSHRVRVPRARNDARRRTRPRRCLGRRTCGRTRGRAAWRRDARCARDRAASPVATQVIAALLDARLLDECEVDAAVGVLAAEGLVPPRLLARARAHADAALADLTSLPSGHWRAEVTRDTTGDVPTTYREGPKTRASVGILYWRPALPRCNDVCPLRRPQPEVTRWPRRAVG